MHNPRGRREPAGPLAASRPTPYPDLVTFGSRSARRLARAGTQLAALGLLAASLGPAAVARAQGWDAHLSPDAVRGERLLRRAMEHVICALGSEDCVPDVDSALLGPQVEWEQALVRLDRALGYLPEHGELLFFRALALSRWERRERGTVARRVPEAIEAFERLRALHPGLSPGRVAYELALLRTRARDFVGASTEYGLAAAAEHLSPAAPIVFPTDPPPAFLSVGEVFLPVPTPLMAANWAEVTMLAGDADAAVERYLVAIEAEGEAWPNGALARFGLALALDRTGAHDAALAAVHEALDVETPRSPSDPLSVSARALVGRFGSFAPLHAEGVFFEPECEMRAYEALGHEALSAEASTDEGRRARLESALGSWRAFLEEGGREGPWGARAEENVSRLEALLSRGTSR